MSERNKPQGEMSPLMLVMVVHYYARHVQPYAHNDPDHANSPAVAKQRQELIDGGVIVADPNAGSGYRVTENGDAFVRSCLITGAVALKFGAELVQQRSKMN